MSSTPNLLISHIASNQAAKEVTANAAFDDLDLALTNKLVHAMADADYTLADPSEARQNMVFAFTGAITADRHIILPASKKLYIVSNQTTGGHNLIFKVASGTTVSLANVSSNYITLYCDGTNVVAISVAGGSDSETSAIQFVIDGGGSVPATGAWGQISIPYNCTITGWTITGDASGSAVIDVLRSTYSGFPTTSSIAGTDKPTLSSAQKNTDSTLTGWGSTALSAGDELQINLNSVTTCKRLNLTITVTVP
jgi:hypothetical protein